MSDARCIQTAIHLAVGCIVLAIVLRTWFVMGWIEPVTVAGNSMAPTLCGPHQAGQCPRCEHPLRVGAEFIPSSGTVVCPSCREPHTKTAALLARRGDRLWIDRTSLLWRSPHRGDVVVLRSPDDGSQLCVKRVVGLPGETLELRGGDVWINDQLAVKSLRQQRATRQWVCCEDGLQPRWKPEDSQWQWHDRTWQLEADNHSSYHWLRYNHADNQPITDDFPYNASLSRQLHPVHDLMLSLRLNVGPSSQRQAIAIEVCYGKQPLVVELNLERAILRLRQKNAQLQLVALSPQSRNQLRRGTVLLEVSTFDQQLLLAIDGRVELRYSLPQVREFRGTAQPFSMGALGHAIGLSNLTLWRDLYYPERAVGTLGSPAVARWRLAEDEFFVLGDNSPISLDSRTWGPVSAHWLLGIPLFVR